MMKYVCDFEVWFSNITSPGYVQKNPKPKVCSENQEGNAVIKSCMHVLNVFTNIWLPRCVSMSFAYITDYYMSNNKEIDTSFYK